MSRQKIKIGKKVISLLVIAIIAIAGLILEKIFPEESMATNVSDGDSLTFEVLDIGQGSSALIQTDGVVFLVDGADTSEGDELVEHLEDRGIEYIDYIFVTHPHADHYGGFIDVLKEFEVGNVWVPSVSERNEPTALAYAEFLDSVEENGSVFEELDSSRNLVFGSGKITVIGPFLDDPSDTNDISMGVRVDFGEASFIITGDGEKAVEDALVQQGNIDVDVLIAGHHGSETSSSDSFLAAVTPMVTAISVGEGNSYNLPDAEIVSELLKYGDVYRTDIDGSILFYTDGNTINISTTADKGNELSLVA